MIRHKLILIGAVCLFLLLGALLIPRSGLEVDEVLFTNPLYRSMGADFELGILHHKVPVMLLGYLGTLKTLLCWPILRIFGASVYAVRLPMVLVGAATILFFYLLASELAGGVAALAAAVLLATDPTFLLTDTIDWGPVALEHLLLVCGCLAMACRRWTLGGFLFGLALWNKATFTWALTGLAAAALAAYGPECRQFLRDRRAWTRCALAFLVGALPLLLFNLHRPAMTARSTNGISTEDFFVKVHQLQGAADGSRLFGYLAAEDWATPHPRQPASLSGRAAAWMRDHLGEFHSSLFPYALLLAVAAAPLWWRSPARRAGVFAIVFCAVTFLCIAITKGAGIGIHHSVLLWPMPHLLAGVAVSAVRPRGVAPALIAILAISNLLVVNQYFAQFDRDGADGIFTDAVDSLSRSLPQAGGNTVYLADWGIYETLVYLHQGSLNLRFAAPLLLAENPSAREARAIDAMIADPGGVIVTHVPAREMFARTRRHLEAAAASAGYEKQVVETVSDSNGRPVFELWRFRSAASRR